MSTPLTFEPAVATWRIHPVDETDGRAAVYIGRRRIPLIEIVSVSWEERHEQDVAGVLVMGILSLLGGLALLAGVVQFNWKVQNLIGAVLLCGLACASMREAAGANIISYWRVKIIIQSGEILYTTARAEDAQSLRQVLSGSPVLMA